MVALLTMVLGPCYLPEEHFLAWGELWESMRFVGLVELCPLCLFVGEKVVSLSPYSLAG